ncbi:hypothetical protein ACFOPX_07330 [Helicobacter baculiformis]|uniref:Uncharacterized protein n=1 Tax=Helicobacter baculiformis TaxID=427351 RepID=A0ABV7ZKK7_9HELI|nr:hypothetical protein [Helicobacter baculiformis]
MLKILADATPTSGLGHLRRAQKLKQHLKHIGLNACVIAPHELADISIDWLKDDTLNYHADLIVDSYLAPLDFYYHVRARAHHLIVIEDSPRANLPTDISILNPAYRAETLYMPSKHHFLGCTFMPFERAFIAPQKPLQAAPSTLFMSFGGSRQSLPYYQQALELLGRTHLFVHICAPLEIVRALPHKTYASYHVNLDLPAIADLLHQSDIALLGAGGMLYEAMLSLTPILALPIAPNQIPQLHALSQIQACKSTGLESLLSDLSVLDLQVRMRMQTVQQALAIGAKLEPTLEAILI